MELDDHILSMIDMTGIEANMVRDVENSRFESTVYSESEFITSLKDRIPKCTQQSTSWAVHSYKDWRMWRHFREETKHDNNWPIPTLEMASLQGLEFWLARFLTETRKADGTPYPPGASHIYYTCLYFALICWKSQI